MNLKTKFEIALKLVRPGWSVEEFKVLTDQIDAEDPRVIGGVEIHAIIVRYKQYAYKMLAKGVIIAINEHGLTALGDEDLDKAVAYQSTVDLDPLERKSFQRKQKWNLPL